MKRNVKLYWLSKNKVIHIFKTTNIFQKAIPLPLASSDAKLTKFFCISLFHQSKFDVNWFIFEPHSFEWKRVVVGRTLVWS